MSRTHDRLTTVLITAYAIHPLKGSEDAMGWNYVLQAARYHRVVAVTRKNNRPAIEKFFADNPDHDEIASRIQFLYYDWQKWLIFWKKGPLLSLIYFYCWQACIPAWFKKQNVEVDVVHNLNFHNDWTPSFLWKLGKPFVWGPVGHHPPVPIKYLRDFGTGAVIKDRFLWLLKNAFWTLDPFLKKCRDKADFVWCMHREAVKKLHLEDKHWVVPSIASEEVNAPEKVRGGFNILSVGRFVPLKGFDITLEAFAHFYLRLSPAKQRMTTISLVGKGEMKKQLFDIAAKHKIVHAVRFFNWVDRSELQEIYQSASAFLFPSHEGAGMVVAEAMSYGLPVLCWDNCGPGTIVHPKSKLKLKYTNREDAIDAFSEMIQRLHDNAGFLEKESELARERFENMLSWDVRGEQLKKIYVWVQDKENVPFPSVKSTARLLSEA